MFTKDKKLKIEAIKKMIEQFCESNLHKIYKEYMLHLCDVVSRERSLTITRGKNEIWAASLIHAIARLNFLYDDTNPDKHRIKLEALCEFFQTKKSTIGNKANLITKTCNIRMGHPEYSRSDITDMNAFYTTPEGFVINKSTASEIFGKEIVFETANEEESAEIERFMTERKRLAEEKLERKKARRLEINRMIAEKKKAERLERDKKQLSLFGDNSD
jgi:hypothetical protein